MFFSKSLSEEWRLITGRVETSPLEINGRDGFTAALSACSRGLCEAGGAGHWPSAIIDEQLQWRMAGLTASP